jgi:hypothetical protein
MFLRPSEDGLMGRMLRWVTATHTQRYHAHYHTSGEGHLYQSRFKSFPIADDDHLLIVCRYVERNPLRANLVERAEDWRFGSLWRWAQQAEPLPKLLAPWPIPRTPNGIERVNQPLPEKERKALRVCVQRGRPLVPRPGRKSSPGGQDWVRRFALAVAPASSKDNRIDPCPLVTRNRSHSPTKELGIWTKPLRLLVSGPVATCPIF